MKVNDAGGVAAGHAREARSAEDARAKIARLFQFIRALTNSRHPLRSRLADQPAAHLRIAIDGLPLAGEWLERWNGFEVEREWLLRVRLCPLAPCPPPPAEIADWLLPGWNRHTEVARHAPDMTRHGPDGHVVVTERLADRPARHAAWLDWSARRDLWARAQHRHEPLRQLFATLQALSAELQKQSERIELVLGVCHLRLDAGSQQFDHPLVLKPLGIEFDASTHCFTLTETDRATEVYTEPLVALDLDIAAIANWREALKGLHPLDAQAEGIAASLGDWLRRQPGMAAAQIASAPVVFLRDRGAWPARAASAVLDDLATRPMADLPPYLLRLAGLAPAEAAPSGAASASAPAFAAQFAANEDPGILFALPANLEQLQLATQVERQDMVLVQGPPGTGKTHTIANLIGQLLAQGQRVLVTSHSSKALRVLLDKVPESIRPLCVSVLDDAARSRHELEQAVRAMATRLQDGESVLASSERRLTRQRATLLENIQRARAGQRRCVQIEFEPVVLDGEAIEPSRAAREVCDGEAAHGWVPGPLLDAEMRSALPMAPGDIRWLYEAQARISAADVRQVDAGLPSSGWLPSPAEWQQKLSRLAAFDAEAQPVGHPIWPQFAGSTDSLATNLALGTSAQEALLRVVKPGPWLVTLVELGADPSAGDMPLEWVELREFTSRLHIACVNAQSAVLEHGPELPEALCTDANLQHLRDIRDHLAQGHGLKPYQWPLKALTQGHWKVLLAQARCNGQVPSDGGQVEALVRHVELMRARARLRQRWTRQVHTLGGPVLPEAEPEKAALDWLPHILAALRWSRRYWLPVTEAVSAQGHPWADVEARVPPQTSRYPRLDRIRLLLRDHLLPEWRAHLATRRAEASRADIAHWRARLAQEAPQPWPNGAVQGLDRALAALGAPAYAAAFAELDRLRALAPDMQRRAELLAALAPRASAWHRALASRAPGHDTALGDDCDPAAAWRWRQIEDELARRALLDGEQVAEELRHLTAALRTTTHDLITERCWARQIALAEPFRLHLVGWLDSMRRLGQSTGRTADRYRLQTREQLRAAQGAVPVWIMPLAEVFRSLAARDARFDVVIVDEASQAGIGGLLAAYLGRKVVVVGDHEQVSPDAADEDVAAAQALQQQFLQGFPNAALYDGTLSLYDLARQTAPGLLSLSEHFRCVPAIIGFSNRLSYQGRIRPLRDAGASPLQAVVAHRVLGRRDALQKVNRAEACEIVSLVGAMCEADAYAGRSIGVVSLLGDDQARLLESLMRQHVSARDIEARKILCGTPAQFQGDEREVMLLSMVDSNEGDGFMRGLGEGVNELHRKRYNVAASRAQNQMWVVHSMGPGSELKPGDLRRALLEHAQGDAPESAASAPPPSAEGELAGRVRQALQSRGYSVRSQYPVGYRRIDLVVHGGGRRLALECDGELRDAGAGADAGADADAVTDSLAGQEVLERLGWRFHRIRGSRFFRDAERELAGLWETLDQMGIQPEGAQSAVASGQGVHESLLIRAAALRQAWFPLQPAR